MAPREKRMSGTYAQVMRPDDGPGNRRTPRSRAPGRSGAVPTPAVATPAVATPAVATPAVATRAVATPATHEKPGKLERVPGDPDRALGKPTRVLGTAAKAGGASVQAPGSPAEATFAAAAAAFMAGRDARVQRNLKFEDVPAPKRLAPYATAIAATVQQDDADVAWGRLVLLYDPDGQQGWDGVFRLVAYIRAEVEPEIAADPLLGEVGWSWLSEALDAHVPGYAAPSGTVTRVITEGFGGKRDELPLTGFELRASWSPVGPEEQHGSPGTSDLDTLDLSAHIAAWCDCMSTAAGLEPPGTRALRQPGRG